MNEIEMGRNDKKLSFPPDVWYSAEHVWLKREQLFYRSGLTSYSQAQLGEIVYIDLPKVREFYEKGEVFGSVESMSTISELFMPIDAKIVAVNRNLVDEPDILNQDPNGKGWIIGIEIKASDVGEVMMTCQEYINHIYSASDNECIKRHSK